MITQHRVIDLDPAQMARCRELSFGDEGYMCEDMDAILVVESRYRYRYSQALLLHEDNKMLGWCLLQPVPRSKKWSAQFFVDPEYRRLGYGSRLIDRANEVCKVPYVFVDRDNRGFFEKQPGKYRDLEWA